MSSVFSLDTSDQTENDREALRTSVPVDQIRPGFFSHIPTAIGYTVPRAALGIAKAGALGLSIPVAVGSSLLFGEETRLTDPYFHAVDKYLTDPIDNLTPGANEVGTAANILGGFTEVGAQLLGAGGNPIPMLAAQISGAAAELARRGVNKDLAVASGVIEGMVDAAGFKIPFFGKTLTSRMATGAAGNLALGTAGGAAQQSLLNVSGNSDLAAQYSPWNLTSAGVSLLTGAAFGLTHHLGNPIKPSDRDAALALLNAKHFQDDTAVGAPVDPISSNAHQKQMEQAILQTLRGEPVTPTDAIGEALFLPRAEEPIEIPATLEALDAAQEATVMRDEPLSGEPAVSEAAQFKMLDQNFEDLMAKNPEGLTHVEIDVALAPTTDALGNHMDDLIDAYLFGRFEEGKGVIYRPKAPNDQGEGITVKSMADAFRQRLADERAAANQTPEEKKAAEKLAKVEKKYSKPQRKGRAMIPDERKDSIIEYLAKHGRGIDRAEAAANGFDVADLSGKFAKHGISFAFKKKGGMTLDEAQTFLQERGYLPNREGAIHPLLDALRLELSGTKQYSVAHDYTAAGAKELKDIQDENVRRIDEAAVFAPEIKQAPPEEQDLTAIVSRLSENDQERFLIQYDSANAAEREQLIKNMQEKISADTRAADVSASQGDGSQDSGGFSLGFESAAEFIRRGRREDAAAELQHKSILAADQRAASIAEAGNFSLTGSDRPSDSNAAQIDPFLTTSEPRTAAGGGDMFAIDAARKVAEAIDIPIPTGEYNKDGSPEMLTASELLAKGDAEIARAEEDAKGIEAVGNCFLATGIET